VAFDIPLANVVYGFPTCEKRYGYENMYPTKTAAIYLANKKGCEGRDEHKTDKSSTNKFMTWRPFGSHKHCNAQAESNEGCDPMNLNNQ